MQSSYKIIKSTETINDVLITPPVIETIYEQIKINNNDNSFKIEEIEKVILEEINLEKNKILDEAQKEAKNIIESAKIKYEEIIKEARENGYQDGYKDGYSQGYEYGVNEANRECENMREDGIAFLKSCHEEGKNYIKKFEKDIINLAVDIAKHVIKSELAINTDAVYKIAESLISKAIDKKQIILRVNPLDFNVIKSRKEELGIYVEDHNNIIVLADPQIEQGSMTAETPSGFLDGRIDVQLDIILKNLYEGKYD
ncbi:hypothetical protein FDN13_00815 [Caloramator sp. E03]|uniref:FliH/SctL family protein n=1 Tax=Caloramator sp. E03 TaxID=2576307 RepID=UPI001110020F|nr:FliH/SctL family protein [Caloramator sp. E03]QCX32351.1 hypothetical protein FDN13_00815 [Caloramator sp. E03]